MKEDFFVGIIILNLIPKERERERPMFVSSYFEITGTYVILIRTYHVVINNIEVYTIFKFALIVSNSK